MEQKAFEMPKLRNVAHFKFDANFAVKVEDCGLKNSRWKSEWCLKKLGYCVHLKLVSNG